MTRQSTLDQKTVVRFFLLVVASFLISSSVFGQAQKSRKVYTTGSKSFVGYSLSAGSRIYQVKSNIKAIDQLSVPSFGVNVGMLLANEKGAFRAQGGMYYGSETLPYSIDGMELGVSKTFYLLRMAQIKFHTVEPYLITDLTGQRASFFGNYIESIEQNPNKSMASEKLLGRVTSFRASAGLGLEYQLASRNTFINFFAEAKYGTAFAYHASRAEFSNTTMKNPISIDFGVNFGNLILR